MSAELSPRAQEVARRVAMRAPAPDPELLERLRRLLPPVKDRRPAGTAAA